MGKKYFKLTFKNKELLVVFIAFLVFLFFSFRMFDTHILRSDGNGNLMTGESTYGDLPFHLANISQMAYGGIFPPDNPLYAGHKLAYPYLVNILSAVMVIWGLSLRQSIILPGMFFLGSMFLCLYFFYRKIAGNWRIAIIGVVLYFCNGGLGFFYFIRDVLTKGLLQDFLTNPTKYPDYSHVFHENIQWANIFTRIVVPERSILLGIPFGIIIFYILFLREHKKKIDVWFFIAAILTGLLPIAHTHTFLVFALIIPFIGIWDFFERKEKFGKFIFRWFLFGLVSFVVAFPSLIPIFGQVGGSGHFFKVRAGWMSEPGIFNFIIFWFKNTLLLIPFMMICLFMKKTPILLKRLLIFSFFVFILVNLFIFQPYDWDNVKFLFWFGIFGYLAFSFVLFELSKRFRLFGRVLFVVIFTIMISSSVISLYRELNVSYQLFSKEDVTLGIWVRQNTPTNALFLTAPIHNSFASNIGGREIFMGYPGLLWVHGIDYSLRERDLHEIYSGDNNSYNLLLRNHIDYVIIGPGEKNDLKANVNFFEANFCVIKKTDNYLIFDTKCKI